MASKIRVTLQLKATLRSMPPPPLGDDSNPGELHQLRGYVADLRAIVDD